MDLVCAIHNRSMQYKVTRRNQVQLSTHLVLAGSQDTHRKLKEKKTCTDPYFDF